MCTFAGKQYKENEIQYGRKKTGLAGIRAQYPEHGGLLRDHPGPGGTQALRERDYQHHGEYVPAPARRE